MPRLTTYWHSQLRITNIHIALVIDLANFGKFAEKISQRLDGGSFSKTIQTNVDRKTLEIAETTYERHVILLSVTTDVSE